MSDSSMNTFGKLYQKYNSDDEKTQLLDLWHYTTAGGLMGIIQKQKKLNFWFTRSDCLNDPSEGTHILSQFRQTCFELLAQDRISQLFYKLIKDVEIPDSQLMFFPLPAGEEDVPDYVLDYAQCHAYICSFSLKEDSLDMWRYYSKGNGGYGLKCNSMLFDKYKEYEHSDYDKNALYCVLRSYKVIYNDNEKQQKLKSIIQDTYSAFSNSGESEEKKCNQSRRFIRSALKSFQFRFKHECYSSEQEYRFVVYVPINKPKLLENELPKIEYRTQNGALIPYINLKIDNGDSYLSEVLISPFIGNEIIETTTREYLSQCGFNKNVRVSQLPVRK